MGALLVILFVAAVLFVSGMILLFTSDDGGRKVGGVMLAVAIVISILCILIYPNTHHIDL